MLIEIQFRFNSGSNPISATPPLIITKMKYKKCLWIISIEHHCTAKISALLLLICSPVPLLFMISLLWKFKYLALFSTRALSGIQLHRRRRFFVIFDQVYRTIPELFGTFFHEILCEEKNEWLLLSLLV